ncbi:hypothetical protein [Dictyobacter kobayashii]|uniref:Type II secretion system protein GspE N-terminal domain-containing protein n=1 Tax=Dictyobacter kobayashii TaxID=2014872 RepID=A0A402AJX1_9CHLR|nr:hypothetical protein [Dictyobacter kobayashii]GCE19359.1 hypothetical protein KDK_31590 [Dictyobacter kobayashii]
MARATIIEHSQQDIPEQVEELATERGTYKAHKSDLLPYLAFLSSYPTKQLLQLFPYELACCYRCVPIGAERRSLTLATSQRLEADILGLVRRSVQRNIFQVRCEADMIEDILHYWQKTLML